MKEKKTHSKRILFIVLGILGGGLIGYILPTFDSQTISEGKKEIGITKELTNPALNYEYGENIMDNKEINLENYLQNFIQNKKYNNETNHVSVYYRNLNNGNWFGIKEKELFSPASLMKTPLLLVYLKKIEQDQSVWDKKLLYTEDPIEASYRQNIEPEKSLIDGQEYTIKELLEYMIRYSDNKASVLLEKNITLDDYKKAFTDNQLLFPEIIDGRFDNNLKVIDYARFFRVLFNASYVNKELSNYGLQLLTQIDFSKGLVAGVDTNIPVAHKFGERGIIGANGIEEKQLHDCGIIYYPDHPYILCVMTRGYDLEKLEEIVSTISKTIYQEVKKEYTKK
ncbi:MAG TPA: class A beta-lactamase-related serine hydrolase [Candidatus Absconditabacterales bacterium]|nr:class A beta-lactamase-related serine hydrolase [Candidatus Absconditabacterales bacterium]